MQEQKCFSNYLKIFREKANLTQSELASRVGVQTQTIWRWEHGDREPSLDLIKHLAEILHCTESELLNGPSNDGQIKVTLSYKWEDFKKGEINMDKSEFKIILSDNGEVGINGSMIVKSRSMIDDLIAKIRSELEFGFDSQVRRGIIQKA